MAGRERGTWTGRCGDADHVGPEYDGYGRGKRGAGKNAWITSRKGENSGSFGILVACAEGSRAI